MLKENEHKVKSFVSASAIGWYGPDADPLLHKDGFIETDPPDKSFLVKHVCCGKVVLICY